MCLAFPVVVCAVLIISPKVVLHDTLSIYHKWIHLQAVSVTICYPLPVTTQGWSGGTWVFSRKETSPKGFSWPNRQGRTFMMLR